jgi:sec-independent protein translocase protein TatA
MGFGSPWHWLVIGIVALLLFGNRLPEVARSMGKALKEFKRGLSDVSDEMDRAGRDDGPPRDKLNPPNEARDNAPDDGPDRTSERERSTDSSRKSDD